MRARKRRKMKKGSHCYYCRRPLQHPTANSTTSFTYDHVVPKSRGGRFKVPCCRACNNLKKDMMPDEWKIFRERNPEWWRLFKKAAW